MKVILIMRQKPAQKLATGQLGKKKVPEDFRILGMLKKNGHYLTTTLQNCPWKVVGNIIGITRNIMNLTRELVQVLDTKLRDLKSP